MAAMSTFNTLQQKHLFSVHPCKYPSFLTFNLLSHVFTNNSSLKHKFHQDFPSFYTLNPISCTKSSAKLSNDHEHKVFDEMSHRDLGSTRVSTTLRSRNEKVGRYGRSSSSSRLVVDEKVGKNRRSSYVRRDIVTRRNLSSFGRDVKREDIQSQSQVVDDRVVGKSSRIKESKSQVEEGERTTSSRKRRRKERIETPESRLRVGLDMCSKKGDFVGAISLYDLSQKEGVELGQYHYTVLLYLCSSAAVGVVRPAKSGSGNRSSDKLDFIDKENAIDLSESSSGVHSLRSVSSDNEEQHEHNVYDGSTDREFQISSVTRDLGNDEQGFGGEREGKDSKIQVSEDVKKYAFVRGREIYEKMCLDKVPMNEATLTSVARLAMSTGNGDMALEMVNKMKELGINPRLRSYGPALFTFCNCGDIEKAFMVEEHMLKNGVYPEEPELEALLRLSVEVGRGDKVYYLLHKLRKSVRKVSPPTADLIERWFSTTPASRVGKRKWDEDLIVEALGNGGGGWHGQGWLGKGKWTTSRTSIGTDGVCESCGEKLVTIDLDPIETENFAQSVASIASKKERQSNFENFQKWLDYYGPFEAVVDAANVGLFRSRKFSPSKVNAIVNGIRQKLPSKKWPLIVLHNRRITGGNMDERTNKALAEKWKTADALYPTPTGSNDDWYWLYAAIKFKCLLVTNDEMRDHIFQLLGNDFFPRWKERHQVRFSFGDGGPEFNMPPPCSVVIQESKNGHWHVPIACEDVPEKERIWICITRTNTDRNDPGTTHKEANRKGTKLQKSRIRKENLKGIYSGLKSILSEVVFPNDCTLVSEIDKAEKLGNCVIDFQI
ncbi:ribonuclease P [Ranunculus cassubicifolius]